MVLGTRGQGISQADLRVKHRYSSTNRTGNIVCRLAGSPVKGRPIGESANLYISTSKRSGETFRIGKRWAVGVSDKKPLGGATTAFLSD